MEVLLYSLFVCRLCDNFKHLTRCYHKWLFRKMLQIPSHQICVILFLLFHDNLIENTILRIRHFDIQFFRVHE